MGRLAKTDYLACLEKTGDLETRDIPVQREKLETRFQDVTAILAWMVSQVTEDIQAVKVRAGSREIPRHSKLIQKDSRVAPD